jgi:peptidoglycan/xylan/chitin deacetylase (PgdA/CDA1 family)
MSSKTIQLTFDLEEFDIPLEYGQKIGMQEQLEIGMQGLQNLLPILEKHQVTATFFTTAHFAIHYPEVIKKLAETYEIASHANTHTGFKPDDYLLSKIALEMIIRKPIHGFRMPRLAKVDIMALKKAGYFYDSSIHPTWIPGRYNHRHLPTNITHQNNISIIPCAVSGNWFRVPLFWLAFKNFPLWFYNFCIASCLAKNNFACVYFHPWEYADIGSYELPNIVKKVNGTQLLHKLDLFIAVQKSRGVVFTTMMDLMG